MNGESEYIDGYLAEIKATTSNKRIKEMVKELQEQYEWNALKDQGPGERVPYEEIADLRKRDYKCLKDARDRARAIDFINQELGAPITDAAVFGKKMAAGFRWNGLLIMEAAVAALEDANFHTQAAQLRAIREQADRSAS